jgi:hypothetical protein
MKVTEVPLDAIRARLEAIADLTETEWVCDVREVDMETEYSVITNRRGSVYTPICDVSQGEDLATFFCYAPEDIRTLLDYVERLRGR